MKRLSVIIIIATMFAACNAQPINIEHVDSTNTIVEEKVNNILFDYSNVIDMSYFDEDNIAIIQYDDPDVFDFDNMAYITGREKWYDTCVYITIEESLFPEFMYNYDNYKYTDDFWRKERLNEDWIVEEHNILYLDGTRDLIYYLVPNYEVNND